MQYCISVWILKHNCTKTFPLNLTGKAMEMGIHNPCNWHADFPCVLLIIGYINFMTVCFMYCLTIAGCPRDKPIVCRYVAIASTIQAIR